MPSAWNDRTWPCSTFPPRLSPLHLLSLMLPGGTKLSFFQTPPSLRGVWGGPAPVGLPQAAGGIPRGLEAAEGPEGLGASEEEELPLWLETLEATAGPRGRARLQRCSHILSLAFEVALGEAASAGNLGSHCAGDGKAPGRGTSFPTVLEHGSLGSRCRQVSFSEATTGHLLAVSSHGPSSTCMYP